MKLRKQEIYLGDYPWMTSRGTFVINGAERVVVSQLDTFSRRILYCRTTRLKQLYGAKVIPGRGAWLEFETAAQVLFM